MRSTDVESILTADHRELDRLLSAACDDLRLGDARRALASVDLFWARLAVHIRAEHLRLFPAIRSAAGPGIEPELVRLKDDHNFFMRSLGDLIKQLRTLTETGSDVDPDTAQFFVHEFRGRMDEHNKIEESRVYRFAGEVLSEQEYETLKSEVSAELANLPLRFGRDK